MSRPHYLLDRLAGWRAASLTGVTTGAENTALRLQCLPGAVKPLIDPEGDLGGLVVPIGVATDGANIYVLDANGRVLWFDSCACRLVPLPCVGGIGTEPRRFRDPRGIAVSRRHDLFVADTGNHRVQQFALKGLALRSIWESPRAMATTWQPRDVAVDRACWVAVADYANSVIHRFDPTGQWRAAYTGAAPGVPALVHPTRVVADKDGRLYVVQEGVPYVTILGADGTYIGQITAADAAAGRFAPAAVAADDAGTIYVSDKRARCVEYYCATPSGALCHSGACRSFVGAPDSLAFDSTGNPISCDVIRRQISIGSANAVFVTSGMFISEALDSKTYQCPWHRVVLDGCVPVATRIKVDTFTSENAKSDDEIAALPDSRWATGIADSEVGAGTWDCLVLSPPGRYLWLRLTFVGTGQETPEIRSIRVYYPRASTRQYLPSVYQEEATSADFVDRFLSLFDTVRDTVSDRIATIAKLFDPMATPACPSRDFLSWLAGWLGLTLDQTMPLERRRKLVQQAHRLFALRGTPKGMILAIELYTGVRPTLLEHYRIRKLLFTDRSSLGAESRLWGRAIVERLQLDVNAQIGSFQLVDSGDPLRDPFWQYAYQFTVFVPSCAGMTQQKLQAIVDAAKPAHALGTVQIVEPRFRIGVQSCVGIDTFIARYPSGVRTGSGSLGQDTVLSPSPDEAIPPTCRVGLRSRIGASTLLN